MKIKPISALRNTNQIEAELAQSNDPIFITKNGYGHSVLLRLDQYDSLKEKPANENSSVFYENKGEYRPGKNNHGFARVKCAAPKLHLADIKANIKEHEKEIETALKEKVDVLLFPEMSICGYTIGDLFLNETIQENCLEGLISLAHFTKGKKLLVCVGTPLKLENDPFNCAAVLFDGAILGVIPKSYIPNSGEFYEKRHFKNAPPNNKTIRIDDREIPFGTKLIFVAKDSSQLKVSVEICEDLWAPKTPSTNAALAGATLILNLSASNEIIGKSEYRKDLVRMTSSRLRCAYAYCSSGIDESTTDLVFSGHNIIAENGDILRSNEPFDNESVMADVDLHLLLNKRSKDTTFENEGQENYLWIPFEMRDEEKEPLERPVLRFPFLPTQAGEKKDIQQGLRIIRMQAAGLRRRLDAIHQRKVYIGLSGGLDSTLALLVSVEAFLAAGWDLRDVHAITLPAFGTSKRTHDNAVALAAGLGVDFEEINIKESVLAHFKDTNHDPDVHNTAYENAQARMRTMVLMDIANERGGLMVGTGDLSELCLGWCTYGGDHMSMYGVNASIPKTLVRYLVECYAEYNEKVRNSLFDIADTPISPELLPTNAMGAIDQKTEDIVGPYELNDFFIYHFLYNGFGPQKIYYLAKQVFSDTYCDFEIKKWLENFFRRFFQSQFKRSCIPDGPKVSCVSVSPRGDLRMPSDASAETYLEEIRSL